MDILNLFLHIPQRLGAMLEDKLSEEALSLVIPLQIPLVSCIPYKEQTGKLLPSHLLPDPVIGLLPNIGMHSVPATQSRDTIVLNHHPSDDIHPI